MNTTNRHLFDGRRRRWRRLGLAGFAAGVLAIIPAASAPAAGTANLNLAINVAVRSLTVSPSSVSLCSPASPLTFPTGTCVSQNITITNGGAGGHVDASAANALPSDGSGNGWRLCREFIGLPDLCSGQPNPGQDEFEMLTFTAAPTSIGGQALVGTPACDTSFDLWVSSSIGCSAAPGQTSTELLAINGPASSTDQSPTFSTATTWTAVP